MVRVRSSKVKLVTHRHIVMEIATFIHASRHLNRNNIALCRIVWINPMFYSSASIIQARFGGDVWTQLTLVPGSITSYYSYPAISSYWLSLISFAFIIPFLTIYWISLRFFHM